MERWMNQVDWESSFERMTDTSEVQTCRSMNITPPLIDHNDNDNVVKEVSKWQWSDDDANVGIYVDKNIYNYVALSTIEAENMAETFVQSYQHNLQLLQIYFYPSTTTTHLTNPAPTRSTEIA